MDGAFYILVWNIAWLLLLPYLVWLFVEPRKRSLAGLKCSLLLSGWMLVFWLFVYAVLVPNVNFGGGGPSISYYAGTLLPISTFAGAVAGLTVSAFQRNWSRGQKLRLGLLGLGWGLIHLLPPLLAWIFLPWSR